MGRQNRHLGGFLGGVLASTMLTVPATVNAQDQAGVIPAREDSADALMSTIVVTAEKRNSARDIQTVPIAVNVLSGEVIEALQIDNVVDAGNLQPNVRLQSVGTVPGVANFSIRGIGLNSSVPSDEPTVGVIVDGVPLAATNGAYHDTFDLEAIEILRGPQGTLFGRNATGGAIVVRSRRPDDQFGVRGRIIAGSHERIAMAGSVEGPLAGDTLLGKVALMMEDRDGYFKNGAIPGDRIGERDSVFVRPMLVWKPAADFDLTLIGEHADINGDGSMVKALGRAGDLADRLGFVPSEDEAVLYADPEGRSNSNWLQAVAEANYRFGPGTLTSITGYRESELSIGEPSIDGPLFTDNDGTPLSIFKLQNLVNQRQFSQELRYAASLLDDRLALTIGGFFLTQDLDFQESRLVIGRPLIATSSTLDQKSFGAFGQFELEVVPSFFVLGGGRYSSDTKQVSIASFGECTPVFECTVGFKDKKTFDDFSPKAGIRWEATPDVSAYATCTRGFRSGGYNFRNTIPGTPGPYGDEGVTAYELGLKTELADGRIRANLAAFQNDYTDIQRTVLVSATEQNVTNAASATIRGAELDLTVNPVDNLVLTGSLGLLDGKYNEFDGLDVTGDGVPDPGLARQLMLERAPEVTYSVGAIYDLPFDDGSMMTLRGNYSYTGKTPINTVNSSFIESYALLNASLTYEFSDGRTSLTAFGKNLTNEIYGVTGADIRGFGLNRYFEPPRTWGVELKYEF